MTLMSTNLTESIRHEVSQAVNAVRPPKTGSVKVLLELHFKDGSLGAVNCEASVKSCKTAKEFHTF